MYTTKENSGGYLSLSVNGWIFLDIYLIYVLLCITWLAFQIKHSLVCSISNNSAKGEKTNLWSNFTRILFCNKWRKLDVRENTATDWKFEIIFFRSSYWWWKSIRNNCNLCLGTILSYTTLKFQWKIISWYLSSPLCPATPDHYKDGTNSISVPLLCPAGTL